MNKFIKLKLLINTALLLTLIVVISISVYFISENIRSHAIDSSISQAKQMTNQLLITRAYMASVAPKTPIVDDTLDDFALAPAYVGSHISKEMYKQYGFYIKQTSLKYRNNKNVPDDYEREILEKYEDKEIKDSHWEITKMKNRSVLRYSTPIYVKEACLSCHGKPYVDVKEAMYNKLINKYGDRSFDYKTGDLRGIISVAIPIDFVFVQSDYILKNFSFLIIVFFIIILLYIMIEKKYIFKAQVDELHKKEIYEETVIESNNNAIIAIDWSGKITTYNAKAEELFGWTKAEMLGTREVLRIIPEKYKKDHIRACTKFLTTGISSNIMGKSHESEAIRKNGEIFPIQISIGSKYKPNNAIVVANISDISKEKKQELLLIQQSKMAAMGEMIGNIAHQWRQPLSVISTGATGMKMQKEYNMLEDKEFFKTCDIINNNAQYLSKTIDDFTDFIKGDRKRTIFNLKDEIDSLLHLVEGPIKNYNINIILNLQEDIIIDSYKNELTQALINIFNNAKDVLKEQKEDDRFLFITTEKNANNVIIRFQDSGGGIPDDILPKVFEPYFTTKHKSQGTGLGLHMTYELIVDKMSGTIEANNVNYEYNNKNHVGAEFVITLPI
ncbi:MAG: DUF3365 domain-containing protein [Arcobacteraceae bacterium]|nr:DUF3365 domain-containing protein [Arcobacteraceae bacterium]